MFEPRNTSQSIPDNKNLPDAEVTAPAMVPVETTAISWKQLASRLTANELATLKRYSSESPVQARDIFDDIHRSVDRVERFYVEGAKVTGFKDFSFTDTHVDLLSLFDPRCQESVPRVVGALLESPLGRNWLGALGYSVTPAMTVQTLLQIVAETEIGTRAFESKMPEGELVENSCTAWIAFSNLIECSFTFKRATFQQSEIPAGYQAASKVRFLDYRSREMLDEIRSTVDKISNRRLAEELGELLQPRYLDTRDYNRAKPHLIYSKPRFSDIDAGGILNHNSTEPHIWLFENLEAGFGVIHDHGHWCVISFNPRILDIIQRNNLLIPSPDLTETQLNGFLSELQALPDICMCLMEPTQGGNEKTVANLVNLIAAHDRGAVYVKSTRTAGGRLVIKSQHDAEGSVILQSNDPLFREYFEKRLDRFKRMVEYNIETILKEEAERLLPESMLKNFLTIMEAPVIEEEIQMAPCGDGRAEGRFIYQLDGANKLTRTGVYCKYSPNDVAANISLGGWGMPLEAALNEILTPLVPASKLSEAAAHSLNQVVERVDTFAERWFVRDPAKPREFAVDIAFVWNEETRALDFYLIEVQRQFAFSGLWQVDATAAQTVQANRNRPAPGLAFLKAIFSFNTDTDTDTDTEKESD